MRQIIFNLFFISILFSVNAQERKKIDFKYFQDITKYDTLAFYILSDRAIINFDYSDNYLGAIDKNFNVELKRNLRFKVNSFRKLSDDKLIIFKLRDSVSYENIKFSKIKIYNIKEGKVIKKIIKPKSIFINNDNYKYMIDLKKIGMSEGSIIDINYYIKDLDKNVQSWKFQHPYFTLSASFQVLIPEIYTYDLLKSGQNKIHIEHDIHSLKGVFIGYFMPNVTLKYKLVTPTYYKIVKKRGVDVSKAKKIYCKYTIHQFNVNNIFPDTSGVTNAYIEFKLRNVGSILF